MSSEETGAAEKPRRGCARGFYFFLFLFCQFEETFRRFAHGFFHRGMGTDDGGKFFRRHAPGDGQRRFGNEVRCFFALEFRPQQAAVSVCDELDVARFPSDEALRVRAHHGAGGLVIHARRFGFVFGEAHGGDLRPGVDDGRDEVEPDPAVPPRDGRRGDARLRLRRVGQLGVSRGDVADGVDMGLAGTAFLIDNDAPPVLFERKGREPFRKRPPARSDEDAVRRDGLFFSAKGVPHGETVVSALDGGDRRFRDDLHAFFAEIRREVPRQVGAHGRQNAGHRLDDGHFRAKRAVDFGKFHADDAAADDDEPRKFRQLCQDGVAGVHAGQIGARNGRHRRSGAGSEDDVSRFEDGLFFTVHGHFAGRRHFSFAPVNSHFFLYMLPYLLLHANH